MNQQLVSVSKGYFFPLCPRSYFGPDIPTNGSERLLKQVNESDRETDRTTEEDRDRMKNETLW